MSDRLRQAAEAMLSAVEDDGHKATIMHAAAALRARLDEPEQEPVAFIHRQGNYWDVSVWPLLDDEKARGWTEEPLYTAPPARRPLTDEEIDAATASERDALLDHIYEHGTIAEGVLQRVRKLARAAIDAALKGDKR